MATLSDKPERCRSCGARVIWRRNSSTGRWAPLDAEPNPAGNARVDDESYSIVGPPSLFDAPDVERFMPHHATCPDAAAWRGRARVR